MRVELLDPQGQLEREIADPRMKREDVAFSYAFGLVSRDEIDWPKVNRAIIERWSLSALKWIKTRAWKIVREQA